MLQLADRRTVALSDRGFASGPIGWVLSEQKKLNKASSRAGAL
jgi:hypothetical protein